MTYRRNEFVFAESRSTIRYEVGDMELPAESLLAEQFNFLFERERPRQLCVFVFPRDPHVPFLPSERAQARQQWRQL
jgi:hypothetical protein